MREMRGRGAECAIKLDMFRCIRTMVLASAHMRTFIPIETEPAQSFINRGGGFFSIARSIGVLDAQNEFAVVMSREEPIEKGCTCAADVEIASGRGGEADADFGSHAETN